MTLAKPWEQDFNYPPVYFEDLQYFFFTNEPDANQNDYKAIKMSYATADDRKTIDFLPFMADTEKVVDAFVTKKGEDDNLALFVILKYPLVPLKKRFHLIQIVFFVYVYKFSRSKNNFVFNEKISNFFGAGVDVAFSFDEVGMNDNIYNYLYQSK